MNELTVTVTGWVATEPRLHVVPGGADLVSFRLASTSRYYDRTNNVWVDRDTEWFSVRVFRAAALLVERSIHKGQPIVVVGRLHSHEWKADSGQRTDLVIDAQTVGHDLTRGVAHFTRATVDGASAPAETIPEQEADEPPIAVEDIEDVTDAETEAELAADEPLVAAPF